MPYVCIYSYSRAHRKKTEMKEKEYGVKEMETTDGLCAYNYTVAVEEDFLKD